LGEGADARACAWGKTTWDGDAGARCPPQVFLTAAKELARSTKEDLALPAVQQLHRVIVDF
jgi:hypothetical protein